MPILDRRLPEEPSFRDYWVRMRPEEKLKLAADSKTHYAYLSAIACGTRGIGWKIRDRLKAADPRLTDDVLDRPPL